MAENTDRVIEVLREVWRITEWRNGAVYKTEYVEDRWIPMDDRESRPDNDPNLMYVVKSSGSGQTVRSRKKEQP